MKKILFATSNARKIEEANKTLAEFNVSVKPVKIDIDEIASCSI
jgi:inosine/xanthosine triphosphate pyrophosphatase family protein